MICETTSLAHRLIETPIGQVKASAQAGAIVSLTIADAGAEAIEQACSSDPALESLARQLDEYFSRKRQQFDIKIAPGGTAFQQRVWSALMRIPYGKTASYSQIASEIAAPRSQRAAAQACGANPLLLIIPCHRVIALDGSLGGFSSGIERKRALLQLESSAVAAPGASGHLWLAPAIAV